MAYCAYKKLPRRTDSVKLLCDKAFIIASNPYYDGYERGLPWMVHTGTAIDSKDQQLSIILHNPMTRKFNKRRCIFLF